ncbi:peptide/nickel transport system permease protein [Blastococcus sp. DSM 46786]|uniref:ABC transporter permease n=1 Tax=Blastococcus sp. DSM 46786 TaxID=1798227 RepID=UPI0008D5B955|nr:ABC transporter permease [Blastococcus sp. DSM 46786]SEL66287.1 peptide/nickel transport system permease protein [Blastococcus sp. DSM 46786]
MARFIIRRLGGLGVTLLLTSFLVFGAMHVAPGDPASFLLKGRSPTPEAVAAVRAQFHLDDPLFVQYGRWIGSALTGDFGRSVQFRQEVGGLLAARLPTTVALVAYAALIMVLGGLVLGFLSAMRPGPVDRVILLGTTVAVATPSFVAAIALISLFAVGLGWFPTFGGGEGVLGTLRHLTLPAIALGLSLVGLLARVTRASAVEELRRDHVETARLRGLPESIVLRRHVARNALVPVVTVTGTVVSGLIVATAIVETAFGLPGIGSMLVQSVVTRDFPVVQAICLLVVLAFVLANLLVDLLLPVLDPRTRQYAP